MIYTCRTHQWRTSRSFVITKQFWERVMACDDARDDACDACDGCMWCCLWLLYRWWHLNVDGIRVTPSFDDPWASMGNHDLPAITSIIEPPLALSMTTAANHSQQWFACLRRQIINRPYEPPLLTINNCSRWIAITIATHREPSFTVTTHDWLAFISRPFTIIKNHHAPSINHQTTNKPSTNHWLTNQSTINSPSI